MQATLVTTSPFLFMNRRVLGIRVGILRMRRSILEALTALATPSSALTAPCTATVAVETQEQELAHIVVQTAIVTALETSTVRQAP